MRLPRLLIGLVLVALLGLTACGLSARVSPEHRWSWTSADLDRNALNLAYYRGAETGEQLGESVDHGTVVRASGRSEHAAGGDAEVVVRYERSPSTGFTLGSGEARVDCYRFEFIDGYETAFDLTDCP